MREYLITLLISAALCYLITPLVRTQAIRFGAVAAIRDRDIHSVPTARWGGVAMWASMALTFAIVNHLPLVKLAGQVFVAGILLLYGIQILWLPINGVITLPPSIGQLLTVLIVLVVINAVNFIDGMDGLAAGIVAIAGIAFFAFAYLLAVDYGFSRAGAPSLTTAVLVGICLGFLPHNINPAKIFMGDSGSMLLGLLLSAAAITLTGQVDPNAISAESLGPTLLPLLLPFAVLAIPFLDLLMAVGRRLKAGRSPFAPDNEHLHHRLLSAGNSTNRTAVILYLWTATIAFPVTVLAFAPWWVALITVLVLVGISSVVMKSKKKVAA